MRTPHELWLCHWGLVGGRSTTLETERHPGLTHIQVLGEALSYLPAQTRNPGRSLFFFLQADWLVAPVSCQVGGIFQLTACKDQPGFAFNALLSQQGTSSIRVGSLKKEVSLCPSRGPYFQFIAPYGKHPNKQPSLHPGVCLKWETS